MLAQKGQEGTTATTSVIEQASLALVRIIQERVATVSARVSLATPHSFVALKASTQPTVSVFLYRVMEHAELRNAARQRTSDGAIRRQPLALELCYLITPWGARDKSSDESATQDEHRLLGIVMQALYDRAVLTRADLSAPDQPDAAWSDTDSVQIVLEALPLEDLYRIWDSSELAYQLSATYRLRVLSLDSTEAHRSEPVLSTGMKVGRT